MLDTPLIVWNPRYTALSASALVGSPSIVSRFRSAVSRCSAASAQKSPIIAPFSSRSDSPGVRGISTGGSSLKLAAGSGAAAACERYAASSRATASSASAPLAIRWSLRGGAPCSCRISTRPRSLSVRYSSRIAASLNPSSAPIHSTMSRNWSIVISPAWTATAAAVWRPSRWRTSASRA
ncbi:hypothetical protein VT84_26805 [Gemmata sp. SH-PL17]|nr:hypothetical protein VT84_26805 [Gemmata sp. SH-PL17]